MLLGPAAVPVHDDRHVAGKLAGINHSGAFGYHNRARLSMGQGSTNLRQMKTAEDVESYLLRMGVAYETVNAGLWLVKTDGPPLAVSLAGPVVAFRVKVMDLPKTGRDELYRTLLSLNTT